MTKYLEQSLAQKIVNVREEQLVHFYENACFANEVLELCVLRNREKIDTIAIALHILLFRNKLRDTHDNY